MANNELRIRLDERLKVYRDSPSVTATYVDLAHLVEDVLRLMSDKEIGFNKEKK